MRGVLAAALLLSAGCLDALACPGCGDSWSASGVDAGAYAALANAAGNDTALNSWIPPHRGSFAQPELDARWGDHALVGITWRSREQPYEVTAYSDAPSGNVSLMAPANATRAQLDAWLDGFLPRVFGDADARAIHTDMLANRTVTGWTTTNGSERVVSAYSFAARTDAPRRGQALFDEVAASNASWSVRESASISVGDVTIGEWTFTFGFPTRVLRVQNEREWVFVETNAHGNATVSLLVKERLSRAAAIARVRDVLAARGVRGLALDALAWSGYAASVTPDLRTPTPTAGNASGEATSPTPVSAPTVATASG